MSTLSTTAQAAIDACGGPEDLQLRSNLGPDTRVLTSYLVVARRYEFLVIAPEAVRTAMADLGLVDQCRWPTRDEAVIGHQLVKTRVGMIRQRLIEQGVLPRAKRQRYCEPCDAYVTGRECPKCGADTVKVPA